MTNKEAADELQYAIDLIKQDGKDWLDERDIPILEAAISALQAQTDCDCISRKAAIEETWKEPSYADPLNVLTEMRDRLRALPSAQPERKKGEWIPQDHNKTTGYETTLVYYYPKCSECGHTISDFSMNFCPNCGADMRGDDHD